MSKSLLYAANSTAQSVAVNGTINFGSVVRRYGCNCNISGGNVVATGSGYYDVDTNFTFTAGAAGTAIITLYSGGVAIPGAMIAFTTEASSLYAISIPAIIRQTCDCDKTITAVLSGVTGTFNNAAILVEKV